MGDVIAEREGGFHSFQEYYRHIVGDSTGVALANMIDAPREFGRHGIRREGSVARPWANRNWVTLAASSLPASRSTIACRLNPA